MNQEVPVPEEVPVPKKAPVPAEQGLARVVRREDYSPPDFHVPEANLSFDLDAEVTQVISRMRFERNSAGSGGGSLVLDGDELELVSVALDGDLLADNEYRVRDAQIELFEVPDSFELKVVTRIRPANNTRLMGLYASGDVLCTQCEAEGFRRITFALDRPDVLMKVTTQITADEQTYPVTLSNGNCVSESLDADGRLTRTWQDPFPKPSYLFALVAGRFSLLRDEFVTQGDRRIELRIYADEGHIEDCEFAMQALKRAMRWDEEVFGREYDLDVFMVVAVEDFNFGAMENKGLNIFNTAAILASPDTATDAHYARIEAIVAHEYFHNWSGNRVTCRDWFQLSLKEGFTVFRDNEFSSDMNSRTLRRIETVNFLRDVQFAEDAGPLAHPVRPDSYLEIGNFYTPTVYEKGAELVRMLHTLLGPERFRRGSDLYFERFDGQAVTIEDFVDAMGEASELDLAQFKRWYSRPGTPKISLDSRYKAGILDLEITQSSRDDGTGPLHIPLAFGLLDEVGGELLGEAGRDRHLEAEVSTTARVDNPRGDGTLVLHLAEDTTQVQIRLKGTGASSGTGTPEPTLSLLRGFSAPVIVDADRSPESLAFLARHDTDGYSRWDAMQSLYSAEIHRTRECLSEGKRNEGTKSPSPILLSVIGDLLEESLAAQDEGEHKAVLAAMLRLPNEATLLEQMPIFDVEGIFTSMRALSLEISRTHFAVLLEVFQANLGARPYRMDGVESARRSLKHLALGLLAESGDPDIQRTILDHLEKADNLTDRLAAFSLIVDSDYIDEPEREAVIQAFAERWSDKKLVMDAWYSVQAGSRRPGGVERVRELEQRNDFTLTNPNRVSAVYGAFARAGLQSFHHPSGDGYQLLRKRVTRLSSVNPQVAARLAIPLTKYKRLDPERSLLMRRALQSIQAAPELPKDVLEIVSKTLD